LKVERPRPAVFRLTLHAHELSALVAAARWAAEGAEGELPREARDQLRTVLDGFDAALQRQGEAVAEAGTESEPEREPEQG
jgi:hypothetical protein